MLKTKHALIHEFESRATRIAAMNLRSTVRDGPLTGELINLADRPAALDRMTGAIDALIKKANPLPTAAERAVRNLLNERQYYGTYCELGAYEWLNRNHVAFGPQINLAGQDVLNPNGCTIDGQFCTIDGYFDIKAFGFQVYVMEMFRKALEQKLTGLSITIDGPMDVAVKDIDTHAFGQLSKLVQKLSGGGSECISLLNWKISATRQQCLTRSTNTNDPYRLAMENRYYPFKTARQFTRNKPFVLIFAYAAQFNPTLTVNFGGSTDITLRAMARRAFFQLTNDWTPAHRFDCQVAPDLRIADAARLISGLMFINLDNDETCLYLNPRATHRLTKDVVEQMFNFNPPVVLLIDDFVYDDY